MARDPESLKIRPWADAGERRDPGDSDPPLIRAAGYTAEYSQPGGPLVEREPLNQMLREITGMLLEINAMGFLVWDARADYVHVAFASHGGRIYRSRRDSGPSFGGPAEPGRGSHWEVY